MTESLTGDDAGIAADPFQIEAPDAQVPHGIDRDGAPCAPPSPA